MPEQMKWSRWKQLTPQYKLTPPVFKELLDGGQSFFWNATDIAGEWIGQWKQCVVKVRLNSKGLLEWQCPAVTLNASTETEINHYFAQTENWKQIYDTLPWRSDTVLNDFMHTFPGLRILNQPLEETVFTFLCSSTKQIPQIKQICTEVSKRHGNLICEGYYALPTWTQLLDAGEDALRACRLGYRARYIHQSAQFIAQQPTFFQEVRNADYPQAKALLMQLPGVGEKIADCALLFGNQRYAAFPVDTWILKTMAANYALDAWTPANVAHFGRVHFGPLAGIAQQFLFAGERKKLKQL